MFHLFLLVQSLSLSDEVDRGGGTGRSTVERVHWAHSIVPCQRNRKGLVVVLDDGWVNERRLKGDNNLKGEVTSIARFELFFHVP